MHSALTRLLITVLVVSTALPAQGYPPVEVEWTRASLQQAHGRARAPAWRSQQDAITFCIEHNDGPVWALLGGDLLPLQQLPDSNLWTGTFSVADLDEMVFSYAFFVSGKVGLQNINGKVLTFRGQKAPPRPPFNDKLLGTMQTASVRNDRGKARELQVYLPPDHDPKTPCPVIYMTDKGGRKFAGHLDALIAAHKIPPTMLVGVPQCSTAKANSSTTTDGRDQRSREYLVGVDEQAFEAHEQFFTKTVREYAERTLGASTKRRLRIVAGCSSGSALALAMARRNPQLYGAAVALSLGWQDEVDAWQTRPTPAPHIQLVAGTLEPDFLATTKAAKEKLQGLKVPVQLTVRKSGHDAIMWQEEFARACVRVLGQ